MVLRYHPSSWFSSCFCCSGSQPPSAAAHVIYSALRLHPERHCAPPAALLRSLIMSNRLIPDDDGFWYLTGKSPLGMQDHDCYRNLGFGKTETLLNWRHFWIPPQPITVVFWKHAQSCVGVKIACWCFFSLMHWRPPGKWQVNLADWCRPPEVCLPEPRLISSPDSMWMQTYQLLFSFL